MAFLTLQLPRLPAAAAGASLLVALLLAACQSRPATTAPDPAALARSRLYHAPDLPAAADSLAVDNVYSMQIMALPPVAGMQALGRRLFFDKSLSASGQLACASCHDPAFAYGPPNNLDVQVGGAAMDQTGNRAAPSLRYKQRLPAFSEHYYDEDTPTGIDQGPTGGYGWDGQFSTAHIQAGLPVLAAKEMANAGAADVAARLRRADYAPLFRKTFGEHALDDDVKAFKWMTLALEYFQRDAQEFYPYSSKYDAFLRGQVALTDQERRGLAVFNDPEKGNCAICHVSKRGKAGAMPDFTDYGLVAVGVPRNRHLSINQNPDFYDLGLCGPFRQDMAQHPEYCGAFRTPSLRNVALRGSFFHNGVFHNLRQVLEFYATRDTDPARWYPRIGSGPHAGEVDQYDDLPLAYRKNVNRDAPFSPNSQGGVRLSEADIDDMLAFLGTLTDGYTPPAR